MHSARPPHKAHTKKGDHKDRPYASFGLRPGGIARYVGALPEETMSIL